MPSSLRSIASTRAVLWAVSGFTLTLAACSDPDAAKQGEPTAAAAPAAVQERLAQLRALAAERKWTFEVGPTPAMQIPLEKLAGTRIDPAQYELIAANRNAFAAEAGPLYARLLAAQKIRLLSTGCVATSPLCNLQPKMTPVRSQSGCGSCWAFTAMGAWEGAYNVFYGGAPDTSEQQVLTCASAGTCQGGWWDPVYAWMMGTAVGTEAQTPYTASDGPCLAHPPATSKVATWGFVTAKWEIPSVPQLKQALVANGPLAIAVRATPAFQAYTSGVFNENAAGAINHGVVLVGWDDSKQAWRIKNSWNTGWGEQGYMWIRYGTNSVGYAATWVKPLAPRFGGQLDPRIFELFNRFEAMRR